MISHAYPNSSMPWFGDYTGQSYATWRAKRQVWAYLR